MAQGGFTPIQLYRTATPAATPTAGNLVFGELALNYLDGNLFFKDSSNVVRLLASTAAATGTVSSVNASGGTTGLSFSGGPITGSGTLTLGGTLGVANGGTGVTTSTGTGSVVLSNGPTLTGTLIGVTANFSGTVSTGGTFQTGNSVSTGDCAVEVGGNRTGSGPAYVDLHTTNGTDYEARVLRSSGANGTFDIIQTGTGQLNFTQTGAVAFVWNQNGSEAMRIDSSGNVGIGTSSPGARLEVSSAASPYLFIRTTSATNKRTGITFLQSGTAQYELGVDGSLNNSRNFYLYDSVAGSFSWVVDSSGNVGIGTASPVGRLDVVGSNSRSRLEVTTTTATWITTNPAASAYLGVAHDALSHRFLLSSSEAMRIASSGNVGIGTTSPSSRLTVVASAYKSTEFSSAVTSSPATMDAGEVFSISANSAVSGVTFSPADPRLITFGVTPGNAAYMRASTLALVATSDILFSPNGAEQARFTSTGRLGIGTSSPSALLDVNGAARASSLTLTTDLAVADGGTGASDAAGARTNLGATTLGANLFTLANPSAVTFPRFNADNTVSALDAASFRAAIGVGTGTGTVTSVSGAGTVNGLTLTGTVTTTGSLTLGGSLSGIDLGTQTSGTLAVARGGTGATDATTARSNLGAAASGANTDITSLARSTTLSASGTAAADSLGFRGLPQNAQAGGYTFVLDDQGRHISATGNVTIPANSSVAFPIGTTIVVYNDTASTITIAITTDTLRLSGTATTGTRTVAQRGLCTLVKVKATEWVATGSVT